jgi:hypothetical protein
MVICYNGKKEESMRSKTTSQPAGFRKLRAPSGEVGPAATITGTFAANQRARSILKSRPHQRGRFFRNPFLRLEQAVIDQVRDEVREDLRNELRQEVQQMVGKALEWQAEPDKAGQPFQWETARPLGGGIPEALRAGASFKQCALQGAEMLSSDNAAALIGITREALRKRRAAGTALGLEGGKRGVRYPAWQFDDNVLPYLPAILAVFRQRDDWGKYLFFTQPEPLLGGQSPLDALHNGQGQEVVRIAAVLSEDEA